MSFQDYYANGMLIPVQHGSGMDGLRFYKTNVYRMRGNGLGGFFAKIARKLIPFATKHLLPHAMTMGRNVLSDVVEGGNVRDSLRSHGIQALKEVGRSVVSQSGSGMRGRKRKQSSSRKAPAKKRKTTKQKPKVTKKKKTTTKKSTSSKRGQRIRTLFD